MSVEQYCVAATVLGAAVAIVGLGTTLRLVQGIVDREWRRLRYKVDQIVAEMDSADSPKPSHQMCQFLVVGEDRRFHHHPGVDPIALGRAVWKTFYCGQRQGASTIAMQFVRTLTERYECTYRRKLLEMILAVRVTQHIGRARLPALYLWIAYYGWQMRGFSQVCLRVRIDPHTSGAGDSALLVARLKYPETRSVSREQERRIQRRADHLTSLRTSSKNNRLWSQLAFWFNVTCWNWQAEVESRHGQRSSNYGLRGMFVTDSKSTGQSTIPSGL